MEQRSTLPIDIEAADLNLISLSGMHLTPALNIFQNLYSDRFLQKSNGWLLGLIFSGIIFE